MSSGVVWMRDSWVAVNVLTSNGPCLPMEASEALPIGAVLLATAVGLLVYLMIAAWPAEPARDLAGDPDVS